MTVPEPDTKVRRGDIVAVAAGGGWTVGVVLRATRDGWARHVEPWHIDLDRWDHIAGRRRDLRASADNRIDPGTVVAVIGSRSEPRVERMLQRLSGICRDREVFAGIDDLRERLR